MAPPFVPALLGGIGFLTAASTFTLYALVRRMGQPLLVIEKDHLRFPRLEDLRVPWADVCGADVTSDLRLRIRVSDAWSHLRDLPRSLLLERRTAWLQDGEHFSFRCLLLPHQLRQLAQELEARGRSARAGRSHKYVATLEDVFGPAPVDKSAKDSRESGGEERLDDQRWRVW